ncbi:HEAT repeat domain-containing protein [Rhodococcus triatomae]|uniref:HEAT repeat domain-containing protein n=1 Tax=Rhodococcus triatomae TaxID=300028 RepID=UPI000934FB9D|nr:HEAT repeat domain-containing protein [Rhodococcus triatomae]QNG17401.1 HEAT repeat domain-containing protein [Rhodococcus triatomae]QNG22931.1 HEAT repeat domain-containing protein [Rhodococcus triatomae]
MIDDMNNPDGREAVDILIQASHSSEWSLRERACYAMSPHISDQAIANRLAEMLHDPDIAVQVAAAEVLARRGGRSGLIAVLTELGRRVDDPDADHIAYKLQELQGLDDLPILRETRDVVSDGTVPEVVRAGASEIEALFGHYSP